MIPKTIHQTWKTNSIPERWKEFHWSWKKHFPKPEYTHILWTDEMNRKLIKEKFPYFLKTYDSYPKNIQRADAIRPFILYEYGGIYADLDYECLHNFYNDLNPTKVNIVESPYKNERLQNSLMASSPRHPDWIFIFGELQSRKKHTIYSRFDRSLKYMKNLKNVHMLCRKDFNPPSTRLGSLFLCKDWFSTNDWNNAKGRHNFGCSWFYEEAIDIVKHPSGLINELQAQIMKPKTILLIAFIIYVFYLIKYVRNLRPIKNPTKLKKKVKTILTLNTTFQTFPHKTKQHSDPEKVRGKESYGRIKGNMAKVPDC